MTTVAPLPMVNGHSFENDSDLEWERETLSRLNSKYTAQKIPLDKHIVIINNVPVVPEEKIPKLLLVLKKIFGTFGGAPLPEDFERVRLVTENDPTQGRRTRGVCFVEYPTEQQATRALREAEGYRLDKAHVFTAHRLSDIDRLISLDDQFSPTEKEQIEMDDVRWWCRDMRARDQFVLRYADETAVYWNQKQEKPESVYSRSQWTDSLVQWSPLGTYLATFHRPGIALWAGSSWKKMVRFAHNNVKYIQFSPKEHYVFTFSPPTTQEGELNCMLWDARTGELLHSYAVAESAATTWPVFQWSHDESYFSRSIANAIEVYTIADSSSSSSSSSTTAAAVQLTTIPIPDVQSAHWSPSDNVIAYWTPETGNAPARVTLLAYPERTILRTKNLFNVNGCTLVWQSLGDYLGVVVDRFTKSKKSFYANIEVFRVKEKDIPVDVYELKERVTSLIWEPQGDAWICMGGEMPKTSVYFFTLDKKKGSIVLVKTLERRSVNDAYWSPKGQFLVMVGLRTTTGLVEFWNTVSSSGQRDLELLHSTEHYQVSSVEWDPTGRYVSTVVSALFQPTETGYHMHEFHGKPMFRQQLDKFYQLLWRPRPPTLLTADKQKELKKNLKRYASLFDEEDHAASSQLGQQVLAERKARALEWKSFTDKTRRLHEEKCAARRALRNGVCSDVEDEDTQVVEEIIEELVDETIETF